MTNAKSLALVVVSLGGTVTGRTNAGLLADIVRALGGTPTGNTNADLIGQIAAALGGEAGEGTNADRLRAVADALDVDASGTNAEVLAAILTGLGGSPEPGDTNATLILGISEHPPGPGPTPTPKYTVRFHVATDSVGYGSVSAASVANVPEGTAVSATGQSVLIGGVSKCSAEPEEDTAEYEYGFVKWTGADDGSTAVPEAVTGDTDLYAHFSRTPVTPGTFTAYFHVATDSVGYGSVSAQSLGNIPSGAAVTVAQTLVVGSAGQCTASPEASTSEWEYGFVKWTGADDDSTPAPETVTADVHYYAHFSRTAVDWPPAPMDPALFTYTNNDVTGWSGSAPAAGYVLAFPETHGSNSAVDGVGSVASGGTSAWTGASAVYGKTIAKVKGSAFTDCSAITRFDLPAVTNLYAGAFAGCTGVTKVSFGPLASISNTTPFPDWTFYDSDGVTVLDKTVAANLANCTFEGTASKLVKQ